MTLKDLISIHCEYVGQNVLNLIFKSLGLFLFVANLTYYVPMSDIPADVARGLLSETLRLTLFHLTISSLELGIRPPSSP